MGKLNGTLLQIYADGVVIAAQKGCTINYDVDLPDSTNKESGGWAEHINGLRSVTVDFDALFSTTGLSGGELIDYIIARQKVLLVITGGVSFPFVGEVNLKATKIDAPLEGVMSVSGSFAVNGILYQLKGTSAQLLTDPDGVGQTYDTFTVSGTAVTSAINASGVASAYSNTFSVTLADVIKMAVFVTSNSGELPIVEIYESEGGSISNAESLVAGLNIVTLTITKTATAHLNIHNTGAANFALSSIFLFKVAV